MGRIRSIKPEFPHSESVGRLSRDARLLFIQLWTLVDDAGRARASSRMLASLLYPYDDDAPKLIVEWLSELERGGMVQFYDAEGCRYLEICNWLKHQKIDHASKSKLPSPPWSLANPREDSGNLAPDLDGIGLEGIGGDAPPAGAEEASDKKTRRKPQTAIAEGWKPNKTAFDGFSVSEVGREVTRFRNHAKQSDRRSADWEAAWENWMIKAAEIIGKPLLNSTEPPLERVHGARQGAKFYADGTSEQWSEWDAFLRKERGKGAPTDKRGGWEFPAEWPPSRSEVAA